jgi:hypothetical protein
MIARNHPQEQRILQIMLRGPRNSREEQMCDRWLAARVAVARHAHQQFPGTDFIAAGHRLDYIASHMDCTPANLKPPTPEAGKLIRQIMALSRQGMRPSAISRQLDANVKTVCQIIRRFRRRREM